jgi:hypothetical protein
MEFTDVQADIVRRYAKLLLQRNLVATTEEANTQAFLMWALDFGSVAQIEQALAAGGNPNLIMPRGETPLGKVVGSSDNPRGNRLQSARALLRAGADPNLLSEGKLPLAIAIERRHTDAIELLRDLADKSKVPLSDQGAALVAAAADGSLSLVTRLLADGVPPGSTGRPGSSVSPLMMAAALGHAEVVQALIGAGADVNASDLEGQTALDYAFHDLSKGKKAFPILQKAGAVFGKPRDREGDENARRFCVAARKPEFKKALQEITRLAGVAPSRLRDATNAEIPGGSCFSIPADHARFLVENHHSEFLARGIYLFTMEEGTIALLPTSDVYCAIATVGTTGAKSNVYNQDLIAWLHQLEENQRFRITGIGRDFLEGSFTTPIKDPEALIKRINQICANDEDPATEQRQLKELQNTGKFFLWWD